MPSLLAILLQLLPAIVFQAIVAVVAHRMGRGRLWLIGTLVLAPVIAAVVFVLNPTGIIGQRLLVAAVLGLGWSPIIVLLGLAVVGVKRHKPPAEAF